MTRFVIWKFLRCHLFHSEHHLWIGGMKYYCPKCDEHIVK